MHLSSLLSLSVLWIKEARPSRRPLFGAFVYPLVKKNNLRVELTFILLIFFRKNAFLRRCLLGGRGEGGNWREEENIGGTFAERDTKGLNNWKNSREDFNLTRTTLRGIGL